MTNKSHVMPHKQSHVTGTTQLMGLHVPVFSALDPKHSQICTILEYTLSCPDDPIGVVLCTQIHSYSLSADFN